MFMSYESFTGRRHVPVTDRRRTKVDWPMQLKELLDVHYSAAEKVTLVMDNLNTHTGASLYKAFEPHEARCLLDKLDIHYTPKHGRWLNIVEIELSILTRQCLKSCIPDKAPLIREVATWEQYRKLLRPRLIGALQRQMPESNSRGYIQHCLVDRTLASGIEYIKS